ncbi:hypothetical protein ACFFUS_12420 [Vibrio gallaecicus]|uniref:hypothetical protein n=1 Tax=Vibrio gallaecicus TaxID=552386 RepID=UPI0010C95C1A|nr:hypothetical protein [Vibrio gallaecicus]MDN3617602.1 hypothetical protein [Vibrio gallaecicus]
MKTIKLITSITTILFSTFASAQDYAVELKWNTEDFQQVLNTMPEQKAEFRKLINQGEIKDMYVSRSEVDGNPVQLLRFVIAADSEQQVQTKLAHLPLYEKDLVNISKITLLGAKWLDNTPNYNNYGVTITWKNGIEALEIDRVLNIDLQRVVSLNQAGLVTSSYIDTQDLGNHVTRPIYSVSFIAKDAQHAKELSHQFEAVTLGYANIDVQYLGKKLSLTNIH